MNVGSPSVMSSAGRCGAWARPCSARAALWVTRSGDHMVGMMPSAICAARSTAARLSVAM